VASKRLGALPRIKRGALGRGCSREGGGTLPLPRAAAISTRLRVRVRAASRRGTPKVRVRVRVTVRVKVTVRVRVRVRLGRQKRHASSPASTPMAPGAQSSAAAG